MVRSNEPYASPSPSATRCADGSDGAILFVSTADAGQINPLLSIGGELSRRGVPGLWFASTDNRRGRAAAKGWGCEPRRRSHSDYARPCEYAVGMTSFGMISTEQFFRSWHTLGEVSDDPAVGLRVASTARSGFVRRSPAASRLGSG